MTMFQTIYQADLRLLMWCQKSRFYPQFIALVRAISRTGDGYLQVLFPLLYLIVNPVQGTMFFQLAAMAFAIERPLYFILKNILKRRRPPEVVPDFTSIICASDQFSFPSGHTMAAFLLAGLAVTTIGLSAVGLYLWAVAVAISRVILGVHFPSDILAGATLGSLVTYVVMTI